MVESDRLTKGPCCIYVYWTSFIALQAIIYKGTYKRTAVTPPLELTTVQTINVINLIHIQFLFIVAW